jgi:hypothetical protein
MFVIGYTLYINNWETEDRKLVLEYVILSCLGVHLKPRLKCASAMESKLVSIQTDHSITFQPPLYLLQI